MLKWNKIHFSWELWETSTCQRSSQMINQFSSDWLRTCSLMLSQRKRNPLNWRSYARWQLKTIWDFILKNNSWLSASIWQIFLMWDIVCSLLARLVVVKLQSGKHYCKLTRTTRKTDNTILWIQRPSHQMSYSVAIQSQKNGEMVCCQWSWKTKTSANKNTKRPTFINGVFWTVTLIPNGLNLLTLSWMITKCSHLCRTIVFL